MSWKKQFNTARNSRGVDHEVGGVKMRFYLNRMALLEKARDLSEPVACAISVLFADESKDSGSVVKRHHEGETGTESDFFHEEISTAAITLEMATHRQGERERAIRTIFDVVADKRSVMLLGGLFMDSLRDLFPYKVDRDPRDVDEFLYGTEGEDSDYTGLDLGLLVQLLAGWMKANGTVFGESGEKMVGLVKDRLEQLQSVSDLEVTEKGPTSGKSSRKPSSPPSDSDSLPSTSTD